MIFNKKSGKQTLKHNTMASRRPAFGQQEEPPSKRPSFGGGMQKQRPSFGGGATKTAPPPRRRGPPPPPKSGTGKPVQVSADELAAIEYVEMQKRKEKEQLLMQQNNASPSRAAFGGGQSNSKLKQRVATPKIISKAKARAIARWKRGGLKAAHYGFSKRATNVNDFKALRGAGITSYKLELYEEGRQYLQKIINITDDEWKKSKLKRDKFVDAKLLRALAVSHYQVARKNAAIVEYDHDLNYLNFEAAQKVFAPALRHMENAADPNLLLQAGKCYEGLADWQGALAIYGSIIAGFPRYKLMTTVILRAVALLAQTGQMPTAASYCERILDLPPPGLKQDDMMFILARVYELAKRQSEAEDTYKEVHRLYNKRQMLLKQRKITKQQEKEREEEKQTNTNKENTATYDLQQDEEFKQWADQDQEGPALECVNYGDFRSWRTWYDNPETWRRRMQRFASVLDLPIFAADANVEILRREQKTGKATPQTWLSLSHIKHRLRDSAVSLQSALKALDLDRYNATIRKYVAHKDPDGWAETFLLEEKSATDIQRVLIRGNKGRWLAFLKKNEYAMQVNSALYIQRVRRGQLGRRVAVMKRRQVNSAIVVQKHYRRIIAKKFVLEKRNRKKAAKTIQKRARLNFHRKKAAIKIQKIMRGVLGCKKAHVQRCKIKSATQMQGVFRSYKWRKIAREIKVARDALVNIQRVWKGYVARTYYYYIHSRFVGARGVQRIGRGWRIRRRIRALKSMSATCIQKLIRGHFGRIRVGNLRSAVRHHMLHTPVVQLMRAASIVADCAWLSRHALTDIHYLNDAFASASVVSETNILNSKDAKRIGAMLYKNSMVKNLILSSGDMGDAGCEAIASALVHNKNLRTLALGPNNITDIGATALSKTLKNHNYSLRHLCIDFNPLGSVGSKIILSAVGDFFCRNYGQLQRLTLSACGVDDACASVLGDLLYMNRRLMYVDLSGNKIADVAVKDISTALKNNSTLIGLDLRGNMIRSEGALALASCLRNRNENELEEENNAGEYNQTLQMLKVDCNLILDRGALALLDVFRTSDALQIITISGNPLGEITMEKFVALGEEKQMQKNNNNNGDGNEYENGNEKQLVSPQSVTSPTHHVKRLPTLKMHSPPEPLNKPYVPTTLSDGSVFPAPLTGKKLFYDNEKKRKAAGSDGYADQYSALPLSLDSVVPPELRRSYVSLDRSNAYDPLSLSRPLNPTYTADVTFPSPSVPRRMYRRRRSPVRIAPRHTAKARPNVFLAMVQPPAMHLNPIHKIDQNIMKANPRHLLSRSQIKSQARNIFGSTDGRGVAGRY